jgi:hypothetical protein
VGLSRSLFFPELDPDPVGTGIKVSTFNGIEPWNPVELLYWIPSLNELFSQKVLTVSKIPKKCFAWIGIGMGFCRVRDGRDEKTTVPSDPIWHP